MNPEERKELMDAYKDMQDRGASRGKYATDPDPKSFVKIFCCDEFERSVMNDKIVMTDQGWIEWVSKDLMNEVYRGIETCPFCSTSLIKSETDEVTIKRRVEKMMADAAKEVIEKVRKSSPVAITIADGAGALKVYRLPHDYLVRAKAFLDKLNDEWEADQVPF